MSILDQEYTEDTLDEIRHEHRVTEYNDQDYCWVCGQEAQYKYLVFSNDPYFEGACEEHKNYTHFDTRLYARHPEPTKG